LNVRSKSVPFLDQPPALTGKMAGDVGFDPVGFSSYWADVNELFVSNIILRKTETLFIF